MIRLLFICSILSFTSISLAEEQYYENKITHKLLRGLSNASLSIIEIPKNIIKVSNDTNVIYGLSGGFFLGALNTFGRTLVGVVDIISFPVATKPVVYPVHPWQNYLKSNTQYDNLFETDY